jgi:hypothetical protein
MKPRLFPLFATAAFVIVISGISWGAKFTRVDVWWDTSEVSLSKGAFDDGNPLYLCGPVESYFGDSGRGFVMLTDDTPRALIFNFDPGSAAWQRSGLPGTFVAAVDIHGTNYSGQFEEMKVGGTAQVGMDVEFKTNNMAYRLTYQSIAAVRTSKTTWLITSFPSDVLGYPGFTTSDQADLSVINKQARQTFGTLNMPIRFELRLQ